MSAVEILPETEIEVRDALPDDAHAISAIYAWHVLHGRASFEEVPPTVDEMRQRMKSVTDSGLPWLVALYRGIVVGYCYATFYRPRLIARCEQGPWRQMIAVVGDGNNNAGSLRLHKKHGFEVVGQLRSVGYKKGDWRDTLIMQRPLNDGDWTLPE
ncbi:MAG: GNAT family N-acetyltransferase [Enterobacter sp.]|nr:GNAT family N-acetyltransferase [Enterobacter sp.]